jgi:hypothetical protein
MIRVKRFSPTGQFEGYVLLDLSKPQVAVALQDSIQKGEGSASEMEKLDGQGISLARLLNLGFSVEEVRAATRRALSRIDKDLSAVEVVENELDAMLGPEFSRGGAEPKPATQTPADLLKAANAAYRRSGRP